MRTQNDSHPKDALSAYCRIARHLFIVRLQNITSALCPVKLRAKRSVKCAFRGAEYGTKCAKTLLHRMLQVIAHMFWVSGKIAVDGDPRVVTRLPSLCIHTLSIFGPPTLSRDRWCHAQGPLCIQWMRRFIASIWTDHS
uniref:Transposase n=1 Tax=Steinernema glaseri TaxID=37863 RepID=A0A1I8A1U8_9BILA